MKKLLILSCALAFCLALAACHTTDSPDSSVPSGSPSSAIANESTAHQTEPESSLEESRTSRDTAVTSDPIESETTAPAKPANSESTTKPESEKATESTTPPQIEPETKPAEPPSEPENSCAGAEDARVVADKVLEWPVTFLVKADCTEYSFGERSWGNYSKKYPAPEGYMWVSAARKKDICWDIMRSWYIAQDTERYNKLKEAFQSGNLPDGYYGEIRANGIFCYGECAYANGETLDEYLARVGTPKSWKFPIGVSDIVDADEWLSKNDISIGKESGIWHDQIDTYIDDLDGEDVLVSVDYHI